MFLGGMKNIFLVLVILDILGGGGGGGGGWTVDAGPEPTYEKQIRVAPPPPPWGLHAVLFRLKGPLNVKQNVDPDELPYQKAPFKDLFSNTPLNG